MDPQKRVADALLTLTKAKAWLDSVNVAAAHGQSNLQMRARALTAVANARLELHQAEAALAAQFVNQEYAAGRATVQQVAASAATQAATASQDEVATEPFVATTAMLHIKAEVEAGRISDYPGGLTHTQALAAEKQRWETYARLIQRGDITDWPDDPNRQQLASRFREETNNTAA